MIDDELKNRHDQLYSWRTLKLISQFDLTTFSKSETSSNQQQRYDPFKGNIEDVARVFCKNHMRRQILDHLPERPETEEELDVIHSNREDDEMAQPADDQDE